MAGVNRRRLPWRQEEARIRAELLHSGLFTAREAQVLARITRKAVRPVKPRKPTRADLKRWTAMHTAFGIPTEAERRAAWRRGSVI